MYLIIMHPNHKDVPPFIIAIIMGEEDPIKWMREWLASRPAFNMRREGQYEFSGTNSKVIWAKKRDMRTAIRESKSFAINPLKAPYTLKAHKITRSISLGTMVVDKATDLYHFLTDDYVDNKQSHY